MASERRVTSGGDDRLRGRYLRGDDTLRQLRPDASPASAWDTHYQQMPFSHTNSNSKGSTAISSRLKVRPTPWNPSRTNVGSDRILHATNLDFPRQWHGERTRDGSSTTRGCALSHAAAVPVSVPVHRCRGRETSTIHHDDWGKRRRHGSPSARRREDHMLPQEVYCTRSL